MLIIKKIIKWIIGLFILFILFNLFFLIWLSINEYKPEKLEKSKIIRQSSGLSNLTPQKIYSIVTWNLGNGTLSSDYGIRQSSLKRSKKEIRAENYHSIRQFLQQRQFDLILLQEIDYQFSPFLSQSMPDNQSFFVFNARNFYIPFLGPFNPGQLSISRLNTYLSQRISLPGDAPWPFKLMTYKRCLLEKRYHFQNKELIIYNLHLAFFDRNEERRTEQLRFVKQLILSQYARGNYLIIGGDWNLRLPGISETHFQDWTTREFWISMFKNFHKDWTPAGWQWAFDPTVPTIRITNQPYQKGRNYTTIIDGFLVSPNVNVISVKGWDLDFKNSDHQPVSLWFSLE